jgi:hypothetical protein
LSPPEAIMSPPMNAATTTAVHRARDESEDINSDTSSMVSYIENKTPAATV